MVVLLVFFREDFKGNKCRAVVVMFYRIKIVWECIWFIGVLEVIDGNLNGWSFSWCDDKSEISYYYYFVFMKIIGWIFINKCR